MRRPTTARPPRPAAWALVAVAAGVIVFASPLRHLADTVIGGGPDVDQSAWWLRWMEVALRHGWNPLISDRLNAPDGFNAMWNTSMPLPALLAAPVTALWGPYVAYSLLIVLGCVATAWTSALLLGRWFTGVAAPAAGGLVAGFSPYMTAHATGHLNLVLLPLVPVIYLLIDRAVRGDGRAAVTGVALGVAATAQLLTSEEVLLTAGLAAAVALATAAVIARSGVAPGLRRLLHVLAVAVPVFAATSALPLAVQFAGPQHPHGPAQPPDIYVTDVTTLAVPDPTLATASDRETSWQHTAVTTDNAELDGYVGVPLLLLAALGTAAGRRRPVVLVAAATAAIMAVLSLGPHLHAGGVVHQRLVLPWDLIGRLPLLDNVLPNRLMAYADIGIAVTVAALVAGLRSVHPALRAGGALLLLLGAVSIAPRHPFPSVGHPAVPAFLATSGAQALGGHTVLIAPLPRPQAMAGMQWQTAADDSFRIVAGYVGIPGPGGEYRNLPLSTPLTDDLVALEGGQALGPDEAARFRAALRAAGVDDILVGLTPAADAESALITAALGHPPVDAGDGVRWWKDVRSAVGSGP